MAGRGPRYGLETDILHWTPPFVLSFPRRPARWPVTYVVPEYGARPSRGPGQGWELGLSQRTGFFLARWTGRIAKAYEPSLEQARADWKTSDEFKKMFAEVRALSDEFVGGGYNAEVTIKNKTMAGMSGTA
jgi:hypothetical protein